MWIEDLADALEVDRLNDDEVKTLLASARNIAHRAERMWTPVSTFLMGMAVARGTGLAEVATKVESLLPAEP